MCLVIYDEAGNRIGGGYGLSRFAEDLTRAPGITEEEAREMVAKLDAAYAAAKRAARKAERRWSARMRTGGR